MNNDAIALENYKWAGPHIQENATVCKNETYWMKTGRDSESRKFFRRAVLFLQFIYLFQRFPDELKSWKETFEMTETDFMVKISSGVEW